MLDIGNNNKKGIFVNIYNVNFKGYTERNSPPKNSMLNQAEKPSTKTDKMEIVLIF